MIPDFNKILKSVAETQSTWFSLGHLNITSEKIVVCDPLTGFRGADTLIENIENGSYPIAVLKTASSFGVRYALSQLQISNNQPVSWQKAKGNWYDGNFMVDAGLACFMDSETLVHYTHFIDDFYIKNPRGNVYDDLLAALFKKNAEDKKNKKDIGNWLNFQLPNHKKANICMFQSGLGDGMYQSYWGYDNENKPCQLLIDFNILS